MNRYVEPVTIPALIVAAGLALILFATGCGGEEDCYPGEVECRGNATAECNADGQGWSVLPCAAGTTCVVDSVRDVNTGTIYVYAVCR